MVDAFAGFTAQELEVLSLVLRQAKETVISVLCGPGSGKG